MDHASTIDGKGFNAVDANIGISLARCEALSDKQAAVGVMLCKKYHRQIKEYVEDIFLPLGGDMKEYLS